ncbi:MAG: T9SS type A sorting domain-containing protein [Bacteroidota bacterium]
MKKFFLLFICLLIVGSPSFAQVNDFNLNFSNGVKENGQYCVDIELGFTTASKLGSSNLVFNFDENVVDNPSIKSSVFPIPFVYQPPSITTPETGLASLNIVLNATGFGGGIDVGTASSTIVRICFDIVDANQTVDFNWLVSNAAATVVFDDNATGSAPVQLNPGTLQNFSGAIFPVEWLDFQVVRRGPDAVLSWATATETNNSHFEIERALPDGNFVKVGEEAGQGNSQLPTQYQALDPNIVQLGVDKLAYRLKQVDIDGQFSYSAIVELTLDQLPSLQVNAFPNTFHDQFSLEYASTQLGTVSLSVTNQLGQVIWDASTDDLAGVIEVNSEDWPEGIYYVKVQNGFSKKVTKVLKIRD